jgi:hypothetical protein
MTAATTARRYRVTAALVNIKLTGMGAILADHRRSDTLIVNLYRDAWVPENAAPGEVERLLGGGFIEPIEVTEGE